MPIFDKTWTFPLINHVCGTNSTHTADTADFLLKLKNGLKSAGWTVWGSSNGTLVSNTGTDHWTTVADVTFSGSGAHSWIVLKNSALAAEFAFLIDCRAAPASTPSHVWAMSTSGYGVANGGSADGTTTAAPTAVSANEIYRSSPSNFPRGWAQAFQCNLHIMASSDGECTRAFITDGDTTTNIGWLIMDKAKNPSADWTVPVYVSVAQLSAGIELKPSVFGATNYLYSKQGGTALDLRTTCEATGTNYLNQLMTATDDASTNLPLFPVSICCLTTGHRQWHKGQIYDWWWGNTNVVTGDTYTESGALRELVQLHQSALPWNGLVTPGGTAINLG